MSLSPKNTWLKVILTVAVAVAPAFEFQAFAACQDQIISECQDAQQTIKMNQYNQSQVTGQNKTDASRQYQAQQDAGTAGQVVGSQCDDQKARCEKLCKAEGQKAIDACKKAVQSTASDIKAQAAADSGTGGSGSAIAGLMGAALGAAMGMMMAKKNDPPPPTPPPPVATGALQLNGSLNCSMQDSYRYEDCHTFLTQYCGSQATAAASAAAAGTVLNTTPMTGTIISAPGGGLPATPDCASFNAAYCSTQVTPVQPYGNLRSDGAVTQVNMAGSGEGLGTPYCANSAATAWCSDPSYGSARSVCPACRQLQTSQSATCAANPALCMAQNSPQQLTQIQNQAACAGDPLYTPGSPYAVGGTAATATAAATGAPVNTNGLPVVVLPASVGGSSGSTSGGSSSGIANPSTGLSVASVTGGAAREGAGVAGANGTAGGSSGGSGGLTFKPSSVRTGPSDLIAAGGVIVAGGPATVSRGPASDVESQYGPSLFTTSSQIIRQHCQAGKLNNCP